MNVLLVHNFYQQPGGEDQVFADETRLLRDRGHEVMLLVSEKDIDALALSGRESFRVEKLPTVGLPSPFSPAFFGFLRRFYQSLALCRSIYTTFKPQVILGMGGFTSTAPVLAGRIRGIPT